MKILKLFIILSLYIVPTILVSQTTFNIPKYFSIGNPSKNERSLSIYVENNGSYYLGGMKNDSALIMYFNNRDSIIWAKTFKFSSQACYVNYIGKSTDGSIIGAAVAYDTRSYGTCFKINASDGSFLWNNNLNGNNIYINKIFEKNPSEYICVGAEWATPGTSADTKIITVSATNGSIISQSQGIGYQPYNWIDDVEGITEIQNNRFFSSGRSYLQNLNSKLRSNLMKYDGQGNLLWSKYLHKGPAGISRMYTRDLIYYSPSKLLLQYFADDNCTGACSDYCPGLMLIDTSGNVIWDKLYNIPASNGELTDKVCIMGNSIYITGFTNFNNASGNDLFVLKTDLNGNLQDCKRFGSPILNEKTYILTNGRSNASDVKNGLLYFTVSAENSSGLSDISIYKLDSTLNLPCSPGTTLAVSMQTFTPFQVNFTPEYTPNVITTTSLPNFNATLSNTCLSSVSRIVDTVKVTGIDTILNVFSPLATAYNWNNGATTYSILVTNSQTDSVIITQNCCSSITHVFYVKICALNLSVIGNMNICAGNTTTLTGMGGITYTWNPGALSGSTINISPSTTTIYTVTSINALGCSSTKTLSVVVNPNPIINAISNPSILCTNNNATLTATGAQSYTWNPGNFMGNAISVSPSITTTYSVTGTSTAGCVGTNSINLSVFPTPTITVNNSTICLSQQTATLIANGANSYTWSPSIGLSSTTGSIVTATPNSTQVYTISASNNSGCTNTITTHVIVYPQPNIQITNISCIGAPSTTFIATGANSYSWNPISDLSSSTGSSVTLSSTVTTNYTVTGTDSNGCFSTSTINTVISIPPTNIVVNTSTICSGQQTATLIAQGASSYTWNPSVGLSSTTGSVVLANPTISQNYTVIGANSGCLSIGTTTVFVNIPASIAVNSTSICLGQQTAVLIASGANSYTWNPTTGLNNTHSNIAFAQPTITQNYTVTGLDNNSCIASGISNIVVYNLPYVLAANDTIIPYGDSIQLTGIGNGQLAWISGNNLNCNHCSAPFVVPTTNSCYILQVTDSYGCTNKDVMCITLDLDYGIYIPNCFTPSNDGLNDIFKVVGYGIQDIELDIFDRWGECIFKSTSMEQGWDGSYKGKPCQNDVYTYVLKYTTVSKQNKSKFGHVTLLGKNR